MSDEKKHGEGGGDHRATNGFRGRLWWIVVALVLAAGFGVFLSRQDPAGDSVAGLSVTVPKLSGMAAKGRANFAANCAQCHGENAAGSDKGPPLVHDIYNPGHHADAAFYFAARRGVSQHHWRYGNMPPQPQVSDEEISEIIRYVRELQAANGIEYRRHRM